MLVVAWCVVSLGSMNATCGVGVLVVGVPCRGRLAVLAALLLAILMRAEGDEDAVLGAWWCL